MPSSVHNFHIPVMGTGHSADSPIRVGPYGISSVISLVDDRLLETLRRYYCQQYNLAYQEIGLGTADGRAKRITAYLDTVDMIVEAKLTAMRALPLDASNAKTRYFTLLPTDSPLRLAYQRYCTLPPGAERDELAAELTAAMQPGSIDVNIMVKLDAPNYGPDNELLPATYSDAQAALRGFANSRLRGGALVLSAGFNQGLFRAMAQFSCFYRDASGYAPKRIVLKVSNYRSALVQGKLLARQGLEVAEFRIESGLNCGGHAFAGDGELLPAVLATFRDNRHNLAATFQPMVRAYYQKKALPYPDAPTDGAPLVTVQGGIGTYSESRRFHQEYGVDGTGWGTPFLLVPEATCVDAETVDLLQKAGKDDLYLSDVSPIGVPFNNLRGTGSERWTTARIASGRPGSPCRKGFLATNQEFSTSRPLCLAAHRYQSQKLAEIAALELPETDKQRLSRQVTVKTCICDHLGNGILIALGLVDKDKAPPAVCPGPSLAWFNRTYTLDEMVDHIYGRGPSLVPPERPHVFAEELAVYVNFFIQQAEQSDTSDLEFLRTFKDNILTSMELCLQLDGGPCYGDENIASIRASVVAQRPRLEAAWQQLEQRVS